MDSTIFIRFCYMNRIPGVLPFPKFDNKRIYV